MRNIPAHPYSVGDIVTSSRSGTVHSGVITALDGRIFIRVRHSDSEELLYHFADIEFFDAAPSDGWSIQDVKSALCSLGYGRSKSTRIAFRLRSFPEIQESILTGSISTRAELEAIMYTAFICTHRDVTGDTSSSPLKIIL